jgi:hypothetical protein
LGVGAGVLSLEEELVEFLQLLVLDAFGVVLLLGAFELLGRGQQFLVEVEEALLEDAVLLLLGEGGVVAAFAALLEDGVAVRLLLVEDLHGELAVVVEFLEQVADLLAVEVRVLAQDEAQVVLELLLVGGEGAGGVREQVVVAHLQVAGEQGLHLRTTAHTIIQLWQNHSLSNIAHLPVALSQLQH